MSEDVAAKLQVLINLQARSLVGNLESQIEKIAFLSDCGIGNADIAAILDTTTGTVAVAKTKIKKARSKEKTGGK